jgi:hypothetical protein
MVSSSRLCLLVLEFDVSFCSLSQLVTQFANDHITYIIDKLGQMIVDKSKADSREMVRSAVCEPSAHRACPGCGRSQVCARHHLC